MPSRAPVGDGRGGASGLGTTSSSRCAGRGQRRVGPAVGTETEQRRSYHHHTPVPVGDLAPADVAAVAVFRGHHVRGLQFSTPARSARAGRPPSRRIGLMRSRPYQLTSPKRGTRPSPARCGPKWSGPSPSGLPSTDDGSFPGARKSSGRCCDAPGQDSRGHPGGPPPRGLPVERLGPAPSIRCCSW